MKYNLLYFLYHLTLTMAIEIVFLLIFIINKIRIRFGIGLHIHSLVTRFLSIFMMRNIH